MRFMENKEVYWTYLGGLLAEPVYGNQVYGRIRKFISQTSEWPYNS